MLLSAPGFWLACCLANHYPRSTGALSYPFSTPRHSSFRWIGANENQESAGGIYQVEPASSYLISGPKPECGGLSAIFPVPQPLIPFGYRFLKFYQVRLPWTAASIFSDSLTNTRSSRLHRTPQIRKAIVVTTTLHAAKLPRRRCRTPADGVIIDVYACERFAVYSKTCLRVIAIVGSHFPLHYHRCLQIPQYRIGRL